MKTKIYFYSLVLIGVLLMLPKFYGQITYSKKDFFPFYIGRFGFNDIATDARDKGYVLILLSEDDAYSKYTSKESPSLTENIYPGMPRSEFNKIYWGAKESFDHFQKSYSNWGIIGTNQSSGVQGVIPSGYDQYGRQIASPQEVAAKAEYFEMWATGNSHDVIFMLSNNNHFSLYLLPEDKAFEKYTQKGNILEGMAKDKFHTFYLRAKDSYEGRIPNDVHVSIVNPNYDSGVRGSQPIGYDRYGRMIASPDEIIKKKEDSKNASQVDYTEVCKCRYQSYLNLHKDACHKEEQKWGMLLQSIWETNCTQNYSLKSDAFNGLNEKDLIIMYDSHGDPYWQVVYVPK